MGGDPGLPQETVPTAGTLVARTGSIAIATTSASSILLGAKQDIQLDGGTQMVLGVAAARRGTQ
jgi:hypothetical protein